MYIGLGISLYSPKCCCKGEPIENTVSEPSSNPTLCINTELTPITLNTTGATGIGTPTGLPAGITASWEDNVITISGTPTVAEEFEYNIPLTGGNGTVSATGTITVLADNTVEAPSSIPTVCIDTELVPITHITTGATGIGAGTNLPAGVAASWIDGTVVISGTPSVTGSFGYSIPLTGGCNLVYATGSITITPNNTVSTASSAPTVDIDTALVPITHTTTGATGIGTATGLPTGVTASWTNNVITIEGTPSVTGSFEYNIPLVGGCSLVSATGLIVVNVGQEEVPPTCTDGMDIVFLVDYTGSMGSAINNVKTSIASIVQAIIAESINNYRLGLVLFDEYRPSSSPTAYYEETAAYIELPTSQKYTNLYDIAGTTSDRKQYITAMEVFSQNNETSFINKLNLLNTDNFPLGFGQGFPEPSDMGLDRIVNFDLAGAFRDGVTKLVILITDAPASGDDDINNATDTAFAQTLIADCNAKGIKVLLMKSDSESKEPLETIATGTSGLISNSFAPEAIITAIEDICVVA